MGFEKPWRSWRTCHFPALKPAGPSPPVTMACARMGSIWLRGHEQRHLWLEAALHTGMGGGRRLHSDHPEARKDSQMLRGQRMSPPCAKPGMILSKWSPYHGGAPWAPPWRTQLSASSPLPARHGQQLSASHHVSMGPALSSSLNVPKSTHVTL